MDNQELRTDLDALHAETMRLRVESLKIDRAQRWLTPFVAASALLAIAAGVAAVGMQFFRVFVH